MKRIRITFSMSKPGEAVEDSFTAKCSNKVADKLLSGVVTSKTEAFITSLAGLRDYNEAVFTRAETAEATDEHVSVT